MESDRFDYLALAMVPHLRPRYFHRLMQAFSSPGEVLGASLECLQKKSRLPQKFLEKFVRSREGIAVKDELERAKRIGAELLLHSDEAYPRALRYLHDPPPILYVKGKIQEEDILSIAVVGARRCTHYGRVQGKRIAKELASVGITVVSGLARGIDSHAHRGALEGGGRTLAVLGCGLEVIYPPENRGLYREIARQGAVLSEFPLPTPPLKENFPRRNRIISGLSLGVAVVEGSLRSGSLITAGFALDQGKDVFALPGMVDSPLSKGTHRLIREGAFLLEDAEDILQTLSLQRRKAEKAQAPGGGPQDETEAKVYSFLSLAPLTLETLLDRAGLALSSLLSTLTSLELGGWIKRLPGNRFVRREPVP